MGGIFVCGAWRMAQMQKHTANERERTRRCPARGREERCPVNHMAQRPARRQRERRRKPQQNAREPEEADEGERNKDGRTDKQEVVPTVGVIREQAVPSHTFPAATGLLRTDFLPLPIGA